MGLIIKALVLKSNAQLEIVERSLPILQSDECLIKITNSGVCSSDIQRGFENGAYHYPLVMGHEMSGQVEKIGEKVTNFKIGQNVAIFPLLPCFLCEYCLKQKYALCSSYNYYGSRTDGGFCEYLNVKNWNLLPIPRGVSLRDAALTEPMSVVLHAIRKIEQQINLGDASTSIAIIGAGFLGLLAVQILRYLYPKLIINLFDRNTFKLDIGRDFGAAVSCLVSDDTWEKFLKDTVSSFDFVLEASGTSINFSRSIQMAKTGGSVLWMGNITKDLLIPKAVVSSILRKELRIMGTWNSSYKSEVADDWLDALYLMQSGIHPSKLVSHLTDLSGISSILEKMHGHKIGKLRFEHIKCLVNNA